MMAYPRSIRKLVENLLKAVREINKLYRLKKKCQKIVNFFVIWEFQQKEKSPFTTAKDLYCLEIIFCCSATNRVFDFVTHRLQLLVILSFTSGSLLKFISSSEPCYSNNISLLASSRLPSVFSSIRSFPGVGSLHQVVEVLGCSINTL